MWTASSTPPTPARWSGAWRRIRRSRPSATAPPRPTWTALAASIAVAAIVGGSATFVALGPRGDATADAADAVVADHVRALMAPQPADVPSSDRHTVKPWFNGKIPEAPRVVDLANQEFPLLGGRIDVIGRRPVPTLVYG